MKNLTVKNLKAGDLKTLEKVYKLYYTKIYNFANKFCDSSRVSPDDLVQQTFLRLWENKDKLHDEVLFEKQLYTISKHIIINHLKRERKLTSFLPDEPTHMNAPIASSEEAPYLLMIEKQLQTLYTKLKELPYKRRMVFELHKLEGLSYDEISRRLNISKNTIANHLHLATRFLRKECADNEA